LQEPPCQEGSQAQVNSLIEHWRDVSDFTGLYEVSSLGRVRRAKSRRVLHPFVAVKSTGHLGVDLRRDGQTFRCLVYQLVADAFVDGGSVKLVAAHRSDDVTDCRADNLEWLTPAANSARWFVRNGARARDSEGRFATMSAALAEIEAQAVHETMKGE
jgi:hypothetical protein